MTAQRTVYFNGEFVVEANARVSIFDSALMFGDMIFETTRTFNGQPFRLRDHSTASMSDSGRWKSTVG